MFIPSYPKHIAWQNSLLEVRRAESVLPNHLKVIFPSPEKQMPCLWQEKILECRNVCLNADYFIIIRPFSHYPKWQLCSRKWPSKSRPYTFRLLGLPGPRDKLGWGTGHIKPILHSPMYASSRIIYNPGVWSFEKPMAVHLFSGGANGQNLSSSTLTDPLWSWNKLSIPPTIWSALGARSGSNPPTTHPSHPTPYPPCVNAIQSSYCCLFPEEEVCICVLLSCSAGLVGNCSIFMATPCIQVVITV